MAERLRGLDALFLAAERPGAPLHTMAILRLNPSDVDGGYEFRRWRAAVLDRARAVAPLTRQLVPPLLPFTAPRWQTATDIDPEYHIRHVMLVDGDDRALASLAARIDEDPLDRGRPLWEMHVVEGFADGTIAVVCKLSHALMDGVAGMDFMASFFTTEPGEPRSAPSSVVEDPLASPSGLERGRDAVVDFAGYPFRFARAAGAVATAALARAPRLIDYALGRADPARPPRLPWNGAPIGRSAAFVDLALVDLKKAARTHDVSLNDIVLGVLGGALRTHLATSESLPDTSLVAAVPVTTREGESTVANAVSVMMVELHTELDDPVERVAAVSASSQQAKFRHLATGPQALDAITDVIPSEIVRFGSWLLADVVGPNRLPPFCNLMCSNVAGPPVPMWFAGARLLGLYPLGPIYPTMGLNVTVVSCEDRLGVGLVSSPAMIDDLWPIAARLPIELAALAHATPAHASD